MNQLTKPGRHLAKRQLIFASTLTLVSAFIINFFWGLSHAQSALIGGAIGIIPNFVFALYAFKFAGASASKQVMDSFFKGAKMKMVLTALLFALVFKFLQVALVPLITTYIIAVLSPIVYAAKSRFTFNQL
ncbi:MAG: ATP synthase subunit I [Cognaticolwellia aestuarii]